MCDRCGCDGDETPCDACSMIERSSKVDKPARVYRHGELTVEWYPELCTHCENCHTSLPNVFSPSRRPWVDLLQGNTDDIKRVVSDCPSGALRSKT